MHLAFQKILNSQIYKLYALASLSLFFFSLFPGGADSKESAYNVRDLGLTHGLGRSLGEGHATHFSILVWRIPWIEEPGGLQSMGSQRAGHDQATNTHIVK